MVFLAMFAIFLIIKYPAFKADNYSINMSTDYPIIGFIAILVLLTLFILLYDLSQGIPFKKRFMMLCLFSLIIFFLLKSDTRMYFLIDLTVNPIAGLSIIAGYSYNESVNKKTSPSVDGRREISAGPRNLVNGWVSYTIQNGVAKGLGFGFGGNYASENAITNTAETGRFVIPAYTILNATAFYATGAFRFGLKVDNLTDKKYWKGWSTVEPQKLRQVIGNISFHF